MSDDELVRRIRLGDESASEELVMRYYSAILQMALFQPGKGGRPDAGNVLQTVSESAAVPGKKKFKAYLYTIANRLCIDESRKMQAVLLDNEENIVSGRNEICQIEDRETVRRLLNRLPPEQREVIILRYGEQLSFAEIAKITGSNLRTVQSRIRYALQLMRKEWG